MNLEAMFALNQADRQQTSEIDLRELQELVSQAFYVGLREGGAQAFILVFDQDARYGSPNFAWFKSRYERFTYIDRVIVARQARRSGVGRALYEEAFAAARDAGHTIVGCEVNVDPPNAVSDAFHASLGFQEIGRAAIPSGSKTVRYMLRELQRTQGLGPMRA